MDENLFLDYMLIECYKANLSKEDLARMSIDEKKDYIKSVSVLFNGK